MKPASIGSTSHTCSVIAAVTHCTVTVIYDRYRRNKEKRAAIEKWAEVLAGIVDVKPAPTKAPARRAHRQNVSEFRRARSLSWRT